MASIAITLPVIFPRTRLFLFERAVPYLACLPLAYFIYDRLPASIKAKIVLDAKTGLIKQTFIMNWLKLVGVDRVILKDLHVRYRALNVLDKASYHQTFHGACLAMVTKVVNTQGFTDAGKTSMFDISAVVLASEKEVQRQLKEAFTASSLEAAINSLNTKPIKKAEMPIKLAELPIKEAAKPFF